VKHLLPINVIWPRRRWLVGGALTVMMVASADYLTGFELSFSIFYLAAISVAAWFGGRRWGLIFAVASVALWLLGDLAAGARYSSGLVPWWNAMITMAFYFIMVWVLVNLHSLYEELESRVRERTMALESEMGERVMLEKALLAISEREQRRIGHDLHDSLCQHLTGAALAGQVLVGNLEARQSPEVADAARLVTLIEQGIDMGRSLAHGLAPVELDAEGLMMAFQEFAKNTTDRLFVDCRFVAPQAVLVSSSETAMQLFRIGQEAVINAIKHGRAKHITIGLSPEHDGLELTIRDDGCGLPDPLPAKRGMGLNIMKHRASIIDAVIEIKRIADGTLVRCTITNAEQL
jgi:signal transduction histidine kinase